MSLTVAVTGTQILFMERNCVEFLTSALQISCLCKQLGFTGSPREEPSKERWPKDVPPGDCFVTVFFGAAE